MSATLLLDSSALKNIIYAAGKGTSFLDFYMEYAKASGFQVAVTDAVAFEMSRSPVSQQFESWMASNNIEQKITSDGTPLKQYYADKAAGIQNDFPYSQAGDRSIIEVAKNLRENGSQVAIFSDDTKSFLNPQQMAQNGLSTDITFSNADMTDAMLMDGYITTQDYSDIRESFQTNVNDYNYSNASNYSEKLDTFFSDQDLVDVNTTAIDKSLSTVVSGVETPKTIGQALENFRPITTQVAMDTIADALPSIAKRLGAIGIAAGAYFAGSKAEAQIAQGNYTGAGATAFNFGASLAAGIAGAEIGAEFGAFAGPVGAFAGGLAGGIAGSVFGENALSGVSALGGTLVGLMEGKLSLSDLAYAPGGNSATGNGSGTSGQGGSSGVGGSGGSGDGPLDGTSQAFNTPAYEGGIRTLTIRPTWSGVALHYQDPVTGATTTGGDITDASGRVVVQPFTASNGAQGVEKFSYDASGNQNLNEVDLIDPTTGNVKTQTVYATDGSFTVNNVDPTTSQLKTSQSYSSTNAYTGGNVYDANGNVLQSQVVNADKSTTSTIYHVDANGNSTPSQITTFNGDGQKTQVTNIAADGSSTSRSLDPATGAQIGTANYDPNHNLISSSGTNADGVPWSLNTTGGQTTVDYGAVVGASTSQAGLAFGSVLGAALGGNSLVGQLAASTIVGTFTQSLATAATNFGSSLLSGGVTGLDGFDAALGTAVAQATGSFGANVGGQAFDQTNGHFESLLFTEAAQSLGIGGFAGQAFSTLSGTVTAQLETNLTKMVALPSITGETTLFDGFNSVEFASQIGNSVGGALGSYLGQQLVKPVGLGGELGSAAGSAIGTVVGTALGSAIPIPFVGTFIGSFIGDVIGTEIGDLVEGTPHAGGDVLYQGGPAVATNFQADNGGTSKPIVTVATATAGAVNQIIGLTGGALTAETGSGHVSYYEKDTTVTVTTAAGATSFDASDKSTSAANWANATETNALIARVGRRPAARMSDRPQARRGGTPILGAAGRPARGPTRALAAARSPTPPGLPTGRAGKGSGSSGMRLLRTVLTARSGRAAPQPRPPQGGCRHPRRPSIDGARSGADVRRGLPRHPRAVPFHGSGAPRHGATSEAILSWATRGGSAAVHEPVRAVRRWRKALLPPLFPGQSSDVMLRPTWHQTGPRGGIAMHRRSVLAAGLGLASLGVLPRLARAAGTPRIGLVMKSLANEFFKDMQEGAVAYAKKRGGFELIPVGIQSETDIDGQVAAVENLLTRGVDALVIAPADSRALLPPAARAVKSGVKVVNIDVAFDPESMKKRGVDIPFVGPDNREGAKMSGDVLAQALGKGGKVVIVEGNPGAENAVQRKLGFQDAVTAGGLALLDSRTAHWETEEANSVFTDMLTAHPDIQGVMAANDSMAIGVVKAIQARGKAGAIRVVSFDDIPAVKPLLDDGALLATVDQFGSQLAADGIDEALKQIAGQTVTGWVRTPLKLVKGKGAA